jgi:hypothetical protein
MRKIALAACALTLALALSSCGGGAGQPEPSAPVARPGAPSGGELDAAARDAYQATLEFEKQALASTAEVVSQAEKMGLDRVEEAMGVLNNAIVRGRQELRTLRRMPDTPEIEKMQQELRAIHDQVEAAFQVLLARHPEPSPDILKSQDASPGR